MNFGCVAKFLLKAAIHGHGRDNRIQLVLDCLAIGDGVELRRHAATTGSFLTHKTVTVILSSVSRTLSIRQSKPLQLIE